MTSSPTLRQKLGCWFHERWRAELVLGSLGDWRWLRNRHETLSRGDEIGVHCDFQDSSLLTLARVFPSTGARLLRRIIREWPIELAESGKELESPPLVSVVLPVGGRDRLPLFSAVIRSFFAQTEKRLELIVVEHSEAPEFNSALDRSIRYLHLPRDRETEFNKSMAFNAGVRLAESEVVLLHDADLIVPARYVEATLSLMSSGWEAVRPARFAFMLSESETERVLATGDVLDVRQVDEVLQNFPGLSTAILRSTYWAVGGHDERFFGWGGEDTEFNDRLEVRRLHHGAFLPVIHLWHRPAAKKRSGDRNSRLTADLITRDRLTRIRELRSLNG